MARCFVQHLAMVLLIATLGLTGCNNAPSRSKLEMSAPAAWRKLEKEANTGGLLGAIVSIGAATQGAEVNSSTVSTLFEQEIKTAKAKVDQALNSDLPIEALRAMVNEAAEFFVVELARVPEVVESKHQFVLAFGDFEPKDNRQLNTAMDELIGRLFENQEVRRNYYVVTTTESDASRFLEKVSGSDLSIFRDPLQREAVDPTLPAKFDPQYVYLITGKLDALKDIPNRSIAITMSMELLKPITRQTVKKPFFTRTYMWHPYRNNWELQP